MRTIFVNLDYHSPPLSSPCYNIQIKRRDIYSTHLYLIFKTFKQGEMITISLLSPLLPHHTLYSHLPPNFQKYHKQLIDELHD